MRRPAWVKRRAAAAAVAALAFVAGCAKDEVPPAFVPVTTAAPSLPVSPLVATTAPVAPVLPGIVGTAEAACALVDLETVARLTGVAATAATPREGTGPEVRHECTWANGDRTTFSIVFGATADTKVSAAALSTSCPGDLAVVTVRGANAVECTVSTGQRTTVVPLADGYLRVLAELGPTPTYDQTTGYPSVLGLIVAALPTA